MWTRLRTAALLVLFALASTAPAQDRELKPNPLAPSVPLLTDEEYEAMSRVVDRFILYDIGQLTGAEGKKALEDFNALGPEAIFVLIDGLNRAAAMPASCPSVVIARKIHKIIDGTRDRRMLEFIRHNAGTGEVAKRHLGTLHDLKIAALTRAAYLQRNNIPDLAYGQQDYARLATGELLLAAGSEKGERLRQALTALAQREGPEVLDTLAVAAAGDDPAVQKFAGQLLVEHLYRQKGEALQKNLGHGRPEVRAASAYVVGRRNLAYGSELIDLIEDKSDLVSQNARYALVRLARGQDFGPNPGSGETERAAAAGNWRRWWAGVAGR